MEHKLMELIPRDVWDLIAKRLSQRDRSVARGYRCFFSSGSPRSGIVIMLLVEKFARYRWA